MARRALCARVAVPGPTRARPSPGLGPLTEPRGPRLPRRLRAGLAAEGAQRRHGRLLQQSGREWPRGRRRLRTQPAAACEEPSAGGRRPVRRVTRRRVRGSGDLTLPCKLERERGSSCHARPVPHPAVCGRRPSGSPFCPGDGEGKGRLLRQQPHRRGPGRVGPAPCTAAGVRGAKNGGLLGHRPCPQTAQGGGGGTRVLPWNPGSGRPSAATQTANPGLCVPPGPREGPREEPGGVAAHTTVTSGVTRSRAWRVPGLAVNQARSRGQHPDLGCYISTVYRVTRVERVPLLHPGVRAPRGPLQRRGHEEGAAAQVAPRASSPPGVSPRTSPPPSARRRHGDPRALEPN